MSNLCFPAQHKNQQNFVEKKLFAIRWKKSYVLKMLNVTVLLNPSVMLQVNLTKLSCVRTDIEILWNEKLPELQPARFLSVCHYWTNLINSGVPDYCCCDYRGQTHLN